MPPTPPADERSHAQRRADAYPLPDARLDALRAHITPRLRGAGVRLADAAFDALVLDMARVALRWSDPEIERRRRTPEGGAPRVPGPGT